MESYHKMPDGSLMKNSDMKYLPITVQWNTHDLAEAKVFGLNTKQSFNPQPMDNVLDQGGFDKVNPNVFVGKRKTGLNYR